MCEEEGAAAEKADVPEEAAIDADMREDEGAKGDVPEEAAIDADMREDEADVVKAAACVGMCAKLAVVAETEEDGKLPACDEHDKDDPLCVTDYAVSIYKHFHRRAAADKMGKYMDRQPDLNATMRAILFDWLSEVNDKYRLRSATLHLAYRLIDKNLSVRAVDRKKLQLVGVTCLWLAAKFEEIYPPEVEELVRVSGRAYTMPEILAREQDILRALNFCVNVPTCYPFLVRALKAVGADAHMAYVARFMCEVFALNYASLGYRVDTVAVSSVHIAFCFAGNDRVTWNTTMEGHPQLAEALDLDCVREILSNEYAGEASSLQGVRRKYASQRFLRVGLETEAIRIRMRALLE